VDIVYRLMISCSLCFFLVQLSACKRERVFKEDGSVEVSVNIPVYGMRSLNPFVWAEQQVIVQGTLFEGLVGYDQALNVVPKVADSINISEDRRTWIFYLRKDKRWSNGDPVTAKDFVYSYKTFLIPNSNSPLWASFLYEVVNAGEYHRGSVKWEDVGIKLLDDYTLKIQLNEAADVAAKMVLGTGMPLHQASYEQALEEGKDWWRPGSIVVNGPYQVDSFVADGEVVLVPNPFYSGERGNVDKFKLLPGGLTVQVQNYEADDLDLAHILTLGDYRYVTSGGRISRQLVEEEELGFMGFQMARTVNPLLENHKIRKALAMSIDKETIAKKIMGNRVVPTEVYGPPSDTMLQGVVGTQYDPVRARELLEESGYYSEKPVLYIFAPPTTDPRGWAAVTEALHSQWKELGVNVLIENMEDGILNQYSWGGGYKDGEQFVRPGVTMYTGPMLYKTPQTYMRLSEHTYYYHNYPYQVKEKIKKLELKKKAIAKSNTQGLLDLDWKSLDREAQKVIHLQDSLVKSEINPNFKIELSKPNFDVAYSLVRVLYHPHLTDDKKLSLWKQGMNLILEAKIKFVKVVDNSENLNGWRRMADLKGADDKRLQEIVPSLQQEILNQHWIVPLYSQKLVYVKKPWLKGVVLNKFGAWLSAFNLQYIQVDSEKYLE
jgi:ABC-type oligopeptide transport system substrate-binding subunit